MTHQLREHKRALRQQTLAKLKGMTAAQRDNASAQARTRLEAQVVWQRAQSVLFYAPMPGELDIWPLLVQALESGKTCALPRYDRDAGSYIACQVRNLTKDLEIGRMGIREPAGHCAAAQLKKLDIILVPGVAFDLQGRRLGRGKGFYDQLLAAVTGTTCAVAFDEQIVPEVPVEPHDKQLNCILTPTRWIEP